MRFISNICGKKKIFNDMSSIFLNTFENIFDRHYLSYEIFSNEWRNNLIERTQIFDKEVNIFFTNYLLEKV